MSAVRITVHAKWVLGKVIGTKMRKIAKVRVTRLILDTYLLKYYNKRKTYFAHDSLESCTVGDIVLLKAVPETQSQRVKHELAEIVYKVGRVVDPLTGKLCGGTEFRESPLDADVKDLNEQLQNLEISTETKEEKTVEH